MSAQTAGRVLGVAARGAVAALACALLVADARAETAGTPAIDFLDLDESAETNLFSVTGAGQLRLPFTGTVPENVSKDVEIYLTPFRETQQGNYITVEPSIVELPGIEAKDQRLAVTLDRPVLTLGLTVPELPTSGVYRGKVIVVHAGTPLSTSTIDLRRAAAMQPAELAVDPPAISAAVSPWRWSSAGAARFSVTIRNTNGDWGARGVRLRPVEVTAPEDASFDPLENLVLMWNGEPDKTLWRTPSPEGTGPDGARTIGPKQQAILAGTAVGLPPGLYTVKLAVESANPGEGNPPEFTLTLRIRHAVIWPFLVLVAATLVSMFATKGLETLNNLVKLRRRIDEIRPAWLREEPPTSPVVAARAILHQAERRTRSWFKALFAPEVTSARLDKAAQLIGPIGRMRRIRQQIETWEHDKMIRERAEKRLREVAAALDPDTASEEQTAEINARLDELEQWLTSDRLSELYWAHLKSDINRLLAAFDPTDFSHAYQAIAGELEKKIKSTRDDLEKKVKSKSPPRLRDYVDVEEYYAKAKILSERRGDNDNEVLEELFEILGKDLAVPIDEFFRKMDDIAWRRLKQACEPVLKRETDKGEPAGGKIRFTAPRDNEVEPLEAFDMIEFEIGPRDAPKLTNNYLFKHGLEYRWTLKLEKWYVKWLKKWYLKWLEKWFGERPATKVLTEAASREPRIVQYVPRKGRLHAAVELCREGRCEAKVVMDGSRQIAASGDFGWTSAFRFGQVIASAIAALFAIVSGLGTYYFDAPVFGTPQDYIALFIWGAGVDQMKNYVQNLAQAPAQG